MKKLFLFLLGLIILLGSYLFASNSQKKNQLKVGGATLKIEIADTGEERNRGLSDRKSLCFDCGLLFVFDGSTSLTTSSPGFYPFWMRRMNFDIDIIWIKNNEVVDITYGAKAPPKNEFEAPKTIYQSQVPVDMVLEVNSGWVKQKGIKVGEKIER